MCKTCQDAHWERTRAASPPGLGTCHCHAREPGECACGAFAEDRSSTYLQLEDCIDALEDMARQFAVEVGGRVNCGGMSCVAEALRVLDRLGRFRVEEQVGGVVIGRWTKSDP
jgi:hypothetical protein